jgi:NAD(P)-dependent dehydrogenase (short-subunit alcohol dehydrogenase family)
MYDLQGKVALVTGAAGKQGMGRAIAVRLAQEGADVDINDISQFDVRRSEDDRIEEWMGLKSVEAEIISLGRKALIVEADITSSQQVTEMVTKCTNTFGKIDILVNNSGIVGPRDSINTSDEVWANALGVNLSGPFYLARAVAKGMIERGQGGKIINISSVGGKEPSPGSPAYTASKYGVLGLTVSLATELGKYNINVNAVCPGLIYTNMGTGISVRKIMRELGISEDEAIDKAYSSIILNPPALGRIGRTSDVANMVAFFASSESDYLTGQAINVDGGIVFGR